MGDYSPEVYQELVMLYERIGRTSLRRVAAMFRERHPGLQRYPDYRAVRGAVDRFDETNNCIPQRPNIGRPPGPLKEVNRQAILDCVNEDNTVSGYEIARAVGIPRSTVAAVLRNKNLHPYHYTRVHAMSQRDHPSRLEFCRWILRKNQENPRFAANILFSDESTFGRDGTFNIHNNHIYADENPHAIMPNKSHQVRFSVNIWMGIIGDKLIGPVQINGNLTAAKYCRILQNILPRLLNEAGIRIQDVTFQHDGAPPHRAYITRDALENLFDGRFIGLGGERNWPPRSPDLNPLDFFFIRSHERQSFQGNINGKC